MAPQFYDVNDIPSSSSENKFRTKQLQYPLGAPWGLITKYFNRAVNLHCSDNWDPKMYKG